MSVAEKIKVEKKEIIQPKNCAIRESNPGHLVGNEVS